MQDHHLSFCFYPPHPPLTPPTRIARCRPRVAHFLGRILPGTPAWPGAKRCHARHPRRQVRLQPRLAIRVVRGRGVRGRSKEIRPGEVLNSFLAVYATKNFGGGHLGSRAWGCGRHGARRNFWVRRHGRRRWLAPARQPEWSLGLEEGARHASETPAQSGQVRQSG